MVSNLFMISWAEILRAECKCTKWGCLQKCKNLQLPLSCVYLYSQNHNMSEIDKHDPEAWARCFRLALVFCF